MTDLYINDFEVSCNLGKNSTDVKNNLFDSNYKVKTKKIDLVSGRETVFFSVREELSDLSNEYSEFNSRNNQLAESILRNIKPNVEKLKSKYGSDRIGVVMATSTTGISYFEQEMSKSNEYELDSDYKMGLQEVGNLNQFVSKYLGLKSISYGISTACSSGGKVFAEAKRLIETGFCDAVVVGACDSFCELTLNGFDSLGAISDKECMPFSAHRSGINIGEGAAFFTVSRIPSKYKVLGIGESSDGYHISSPDPEGKGAEIAIRQALSQASLAPQDISYINLHGTATKMNDFMESQVVARIFGCQIPVSSTKPLVGHTLGAAGAIELALCLICIDDIGLEGRLPIQRGDQVWDDSLPKLNFVTENVRAVGNIMMSTSFAFGGSNVCVIVGGT